MKDVFIGYRILAFSSQRSSLNFALFSTGFCTHVKGAGFHFDMGLFGVVLVWVLLFKC